MTQDPSIPYAPPLATWQRPIAGEPPTAYTPPLVEPIPAPRAARIVVASVAAGTLGQLLFVDQLGGINVPVWVAIVLAAAFTMRRPGAHLDSTDLWLPLAALAFGSFIALRDDASLFIFNLIAAGSLTLAAAVAIGGQPVSRRSLAVINGLGGGALLVAFTGAARLAGGAAPVIRSLPLGGYGTAARIVRGLIIAIPLVLVFSALFVAADAVFAEVVSRTFAVDVWLGDVLGRVAFALVIGWLFSGTMAAVWLSRERFRPAAAGAGAEARPGQLGLPESMVVLAALDALFAAFVLIQAAYLFPGTDPLTLSGMTYAEYARRGFFELIAAAAMAGIVILVLDAVVESRSRPYRAAAMALVALIGVVVISATLRLALYQQAYGWTELRFYALAAIGWLAFGITAAAVALAVGRVSALAKPMIGAGLAIALACNVIGPQAFVTVQNLQRVIDPSLVPADGYARLDAEYLEWLGADSALVVLDALPRLPVSDAALVKRTLALQADELRRAAVDTGWPSWNLVRQRALDALTSAGY